MSFQALTSVNIHKQNSITEQHKEQEFRALVKPSVARELLQKRCLASVPALPGDLCVLDGRGHS